MFNQDPPAITSMTASSSTNSISSAKEKRNLKIKLTADIQQLHPRYVGMTFDYCFFLI